VRANVLRVLALRRSALPLSLWLGGLALAAAALQRPAPLLVNLGAGDAPFVRDFRPGWERDGLLQSGETMFRWTLDGARLVLPLRALSGDTTARIRCARFVEPATPVSVLAGGRVPLTLQLLSPARRPVQVTQDLAGFWRSGWHEVRKELRGRYPKHDWPVDPTTATARRRPGRRR